MTSSPMDLISDLASSHSKTYINVEQARHSARKLLLSVQEGEERQICRPI